jgi:metal-sulfur cluster biosynthetic enzyme
MNKEKAIEILKTVQDPEINIDIHTLGLIYNIDFNEQTSKIKILMTFTTPFCPFGDLILEEIKQKLKDSGFRDVEIELTFEPLWQPTNEVKEILGIN